MVSTPPPEQLLRNWEAKSVVRRRCPSPSPSWEYTRSRGRPDPEPMSLTHCRQQELVGTVPCEARRPVLEVPLDPVGEPRPEGGRGGPVEVLPGDAVLSLGPGDVARAFRVFL